MSYEIVNPNSDMALMQASGIGAYQNVGDWTFELFPYDYSFEAPADSVPIPPPVLKGMGCGCGCGGGCSKNQGLGQGLFNTGLFASTNPLQWGIGEWATLGVGLYLAGSIISDTGSATATAKRSFRKHKGKAAFGGGAVIGLAIAAGVGYFVYLYTKSSSAPAVTQ